MTSTSPFHQFLAAVDNGDDNAAEALVTSLTPGNGPALGTPHPSAAHLGSPHASAENLGTPHPSAENLGSPVSTLTPGDEPALLELAQSGDPDRRWWAVRSLAAVGGPAAITTIDAALTAEDPALRACAALAVGHLHARHPHAVTPLLPRLTGLLSDNDGFVRQSAADGLSLCGDDATPALATVIFQSEHEGARSRAASALRKIATMSAAAVLYHCLNDRNHLVQTYAFEALDEMGLLENVLIIP